PAPPPSLSVSRRNDCFVPRTRNRTRSDEASPAAGATISGPIRRRLPPPPTSAASEDQWRRNSMPEIGTEIRTERKLPCLGCVAFWLVEVVVGVTGDRFGVSDRSAPYCITCLDN
ncbi:unnamed protein product, partial [Linum tenue]